jgi:hypothetical protein
MTTNGKPEDDRHMPLQRCAGGCQTVSERQHGVVVDRPPADQLGHPGRLEGAAQTSILYDAPQTQSGSRLEITWITRPDTQSIVLGREVDAGTLTRSPRPGESR